MSRQILAELCGGFVIQLQQAADVPVVLKVSDLRLDGNLEGASGSGYARNLVAQSLMPFKPKCGAAARRCRSLE
jgi:hypothetical protein